MFAEWHHRCLSASFYLRVENFCQTAAAAAADFSPLTEIALDAHCSALETDEHRRLSRSVNRPDKRLTLRDRKAFKHFKAARVSFRSVDLFSGARAMTCQLVHTGLSTWIAIPDCC